MFAYVVPTAWLPRLWDAVFHDGWKAVYRISLALLSVAQPHVCAMALDEAGRYLRDRDGLAAAVLRHFGNLEKLMTGSVAFFKVTRASLASLAEQFGFALLEERCVLNRHGTSTGDDDAETTGDPNGTTTNNESWLDRYGSTTTRSSPTRPRELAARLAVLDETARKDATCLMARIERAERDTAASKDKAEAATHVLNKQRAVVGALVDERRCSALAAARLGATNGAASHDDDEEDDDEAALEETVDAGDDDDDVVARRQASGGRRRRPACPAARSRRGAPGGGRGGGRAAALPPPPRLSGRSRSAPEPRTNLSWFASLFPSALTRDGPALRPPEAQGGLRAPPPAAGPPPGTPAPSAANTSRRPSAAEMAARAPERRPLRGRARPRARPRRPRRRPRDQEGRQDPAPHILVTSNARRTRRLSDAYRGESPDLKLVERMASQGVGRTRTTPAAAAAPAATSPGPARPSSTPPTLAPATSASTRGPRLGPRRGGGVGGVKKRVGV